IGTLALAAFYLTPALLAAAWTKRTSDPLTRALGRMFIGISAVVVFASMTYDFFAYPMEPSFLAIYIGIGGALYGVFRLAPETTAIATDPSRVHAPAGVSAAQRPPAFDQLATRSARTGRSGAASRPSAKGALKWSVVAQLLARGGSFALGLVLARLLAPADFGSYAVALGVFTILLTIDDLGLVKALVRWPGPFEPAAATARVVGLLTGSAVYGLAFVAAPFIADATNTPQATGLIRLVTLGVIVDAGFQIVPASALQRALRQDLWVIAELVRMATIATVSITLSVTYRNAWALAWGALAGQCALTLTCTALARLKFRYHFDRDVARALLRDSVPYAVAALVGGALLNADYLVLGHVRGPLAVGLYVIAFNVSSWPTTLVGSAVRAVAIPHLSQLHHAGKNIRAELRRGLHVLSLLALPFVALLISVPEIVVTALYGREWVGGSVALRFLAVMAIIRLLDGLVEDALFASGHSRYILVKNVAWLTCLVPALYIGARVDGIRGVGIGHALVAVAIIAPLVVVLARRAGLVDRHASGILTYVPAAIAAALVGFAVRSDLPGPPLVQLAVVGSLELATYVVLMVPLRRRILALR
ncbi:MAG TPA: oligosaccharide flippase family protein, partial [Ilumatobacteraceae bacterium]